MKNRVGEFLENVVVVVIVLVLIQTFLDDFSVVAGWPWAARKALLISSFGFDLFFTIEFLVRLYLAIQRRRVKEYFMSGRGWIDFLASIPLLVFNSGPTMIALVSGGVSIAGLGGFFNVLKVVKAIRIARILRLLRILKLFRRIKHTDSVMAQRHVARITSIGVTVFVAVLFGITVVESFITIPNLQDRFRGVPSRVLAFVGTQNLAAPQAAGMLKAYAASEPGVLIIKDGGHVRYSRFGNDYYRSQFGPSDYAYLRSGNLELFFDIRPLNVEISRNNLIYFAVIIVLVAMFLFYYSPRFALGISDPIHVMRRGLTEPGYNLEVKIPDAGADEEVYRLAAAYNEVFLPLKDRSDPHESAGVLDLKMEEIKGLFE